MVSLTDSILKYNLWRLSFVLIVSVKLSLYRMRFNEARRPRCVARSLDSMLNQEEG